MSARDNPSDTTAMPMATATTTPALVLTASQWNQVIARLQNSTGFWHGGSETVTRDVLSPSVELASADISDLVVPHYALKMTFILEPAVFRNPGTVTVERQHVSAACMAAKLHGWGAGWTDKYSTTGSKGNRWLVRVQGEYKGEI